MTVLLIATARALLKHETASNATVVLDHEAPAYYGVSWFPNNANVYLTNSGGVGNLTSIEGYMRSEIGHMSVLGKTASPQLFSNPHQLRCIEPPYVAVTNTGRNALTIVNTDDWSIRELRIDDVHWDRFDPLGQGSHFNSIDFRDGRLHVLAHNFDAGAYEWQIEWPSLKTISRRPLPGKQLHNLWHRDNDTYIACDSPNSGLIELNSGRSLWQHPEHKFYTRGLASDGRHIYVGTTEIAARGERDTRSSRVIVLDAETYQMQASIDLGPFADVNEIRVADGVDLCHPQGPLQHVSMLPSVPVTDAIDHRAKTSTHSSAPATNIQNLIRERDIARDVAQEAEVQRARLSNERAAMMVERDTAIAARDEALTQQRQLRGEVDARIQERDSNAAERDEALAQQERLQGELMARIAERDTATAERDEARVQETQIRQQLADRSAAEASSATGDSAQDNRSSPAISSEKQLGWLRSLLPRRRRT